MPLTGRLGPVLTGNTWRNADCALSWTSTWNGPGPCGTNPKVITESPLSEMSASGLKISALPYDTVISWI